MLYLFVGRCISLPNFQNPILEIRPISPILQYNYPNLKKTLLFAFICLLLASCKKPQDFEFRQAKNVKIETLGFNKTALSVDIVYFNPNRFGLVLKNVDCDVYVNNAYLGKFQLDTTLHISPKAEFEIPAHIVVDISSVLKNGLNMLFNREILINLKGTTRVGKSGFYKTVPFIFETKQQISLF